MDGLNRKKPEKMLDILPGFPYIVSMTKHENNLQTKLEKSKYLCSVNLTHHVFNIKRQREYALYLSLHKRIKHFLPTEQISQEIINSGLSYVTFHKYLKWLNHNGWIEIEDQGIHIIAHNKIIRKYFPDLKFKYQKNKPQNKGGKAKFYAIFENINKLIVAEMQKEKLRRSLKSIHIKRLESRVIYTGCRNPKNKLHTLDYISGSLAGKILNVTERQGLRILNKLAKLKLIGLGKAYRPQIACGDISYSQIRELQKWRRVADKTPIGFPLKYHNKLFLNLGRFVSF